MKRTNAESRPSFGHQTGDPSNNQINVQESLHIFRAAAALKRNRVASGDTARTISDSFNPIKTDLPTTFAPALYSPEHSPASQVPQITSIFEIRKFAIKNLKTEPHTSDPPRNRFYQDSLSNLRNAVDDILHVPPKATAISLTTLSGACQALVLAGPTWRESLYTQLKTQLEEKLSKSKLVFSKAYRPSRSWTPYSPPIQLI